MKCRRCDYECPPDFDFCPKCATPVQVTCPHCSFRAPAAFAFCPMCATALTAAAEEPGLPALDEAIQRLVPKEYAERLLASGGQIAGERRRVTILMSDVKGSSAMARGMDPEEVMEIMDGAFEVLIEPIARYEGTVARLEGDAIMAFFGAPIAHEDDAERACRAGLEIVEGAQAYAARLEEERGISGFNVRVGIHTGLVVVGEVGTDLRMEYTAIGEAPNLTARLESAAEPGTVLISEEAHQFIAPLFETQPLEPIQVKDWEQPLPVFRLLAAKELPGKVRGIAGLESPLVGREAEFAALQEALERLQAGVGGIVTLVGEAGIGKSRLVAELRKENLAKVHANRQVRTPSQGLAVPQWVEGRCLSYGTSIPYLPWLDVLRSALGVSLEESPGAVAEALARWVERVCPEGVDAVYPYLARLMSLPLEEKHEGMLEQLDGQQLRERTFAAAETALRCSAEHQPVVLVLEDLHWADGTSLALLEHLLPLIDQAPLLVLAVLRPHKEHGSWRLREIAARRYTDRHLDLFLDPLTPSDSASLVANLLKVERLPTRLRERILHRAEGNPFYVEEVIRSLIDSAAIVQDEGTGRWTATREVADIPIPDTLQGVLMARIDRLQEDTKRVLQMASVIGRIFLYRVLAAIAEEERRLDQQLFTLQQEEMIRERARLPELEYIFKHELTREAAYTGLLKRERRVFHRQVAEALERLYPERVEEQVELLAHHWLQAGDRDKAVEYLIRAGDRARRHYACTEAVSVYTQALDLVEASKRPDSAELTAELLERRGRAHAARENMGDARDDFHRVLTWSRQAGDKRREAEVLVRLIQPLLVGHQLDEAMAHAQEAYSIASELQDNPLIARSTGALGGALCVKGELDKARVYLRAALAAGRAPGASEGLGDALFYAMLERNWVADWNGVLALTDEAVQFAEEKRNPSLACGALLCSALAQCALGDYELALETLAQADEVAITAQMANAPAELLNTYGWVYQEIYNLERSAGLNARCAQLAHDLGEIETEANALVNLGVDYLWQHELGAAEDCFETAHALLERQFGGFRWRWRTRLLAAWGDLCLARGEANGALDYAGQCLQLAHETSARKNLVKGWKLKGEALAALGRAEEAIACLKKAMSTAEEIGNPPLVWKSRFALAGVLEQLGRNEEAQQHYDQAAAVVEHTAAGLSDPVMRKTFLLAGPVRADLDARG